MIFPALRRTIDSEKGGAHVAKIQVIVGLLCITHPLLPSLGVSLAVCAIGLGLIVSALLAGVDDEEAHDLDFSR
jgi:hypothetical protein